MIGYQCPDCGGDMRKELLLCYPPIYQARCTQCDAMYQFRGDLGRQPFPKEYQRIDPRVEQTEGDGHD